MEKMRVKKRGQYWRVTLYVPGAKDVLFVKWDNCKSFVWTVLSTGIYHGLVDGVE